MMVWLLIPVARIIIIPHVDKIKTQCVPCDTCCVYTHSVTRSGVGFFCPLGLVLQGGFAVKRRCLLTLCHPMPAGMLPQFVRGMTFDANRIRSCVVHRSQRCPGWMSNHIPSRGDECRLSARLHSRLVKDSPPAQGWSTVCLDSLCDVPGCR